jgi:hypothetical protein
MPEAAVAPFGARSYGAGESSLVVSSAGPTSTIPVMRA